MRAASISRRSPGRPARLLRRLLLAGRSDPLGHLLVVQLAQASKVRKDLLAVDAFGVALSVDPRLRAFAAAGAVGADHFAAVALAGGHRALAAGRLHAAVVLAVRRQLLTELIDLRDQEREGLIRLVMEGHLRGIIGQLTVEEIVKQPEMVSDRMRSTCAEDMNKMGLEVISFTIKEVRDKNEYITNMGKPDVARIKRDADVATAEADRDTAIKRALAQRESAVARAQADQERVLAETLSLAKQAEAQRDLEVKKAQYVEVTKRQQAQADKAYDIQTNIMQQQVIAEQVKVQQIEKEQQVKVQEAEINRREKELIATVLKGAEIERQRIETLALAEKQRLMSEADGHASAIRAQGEAEAEIIFKKGEAEAKAMNVKAEAYQEYNQAAVIDKLFTGMPEIVRALASPLANVDKITIVSTGNGDASGMNKITGDIAKMAAQVPALFETLSGMPMSELLGKVRQIGDKTPRPDALPSNGGAGK